jgi:hypothetical protein
MRAGPSIRAYVLAGFSAIASFGLAVAPARADNQTPTVSPVLTDTSSLPYTVQIRQREMPFTLPTLQAFSPGQINGLWVLFGGRTNGMHGFSGNPLANFPPRRQSTRIWVIDPVSGRRWSRELSDSSLTDDQVDMLSSFAAQEVQVGNTLYFVGGYGYSRSLDDFTTYSTMTAFDLDKIVNWVRRLEDAPGGNADLANLIRQTSNDVLKVTGGKLTMIGNRAILAFGQLFDGGYGSSNPVQVYTTQVRSFRIIDDGQTLSIAGIRQIPAAPNPTDYRRRDYTLIPFIDSSGGQTVPMAAALAGVFTESTGMFTVPVEIAGNGRPTMADPTLGSTFKQAMSGYDCAFLPIYDGRRGDSHAVLFGGISYVYYRKSTNTFIEDTNFPFINDITALVRKSNGRYRQLLVGAFPNIKTTDNKRLRFGAEAVVFIDPSIPVTSNGMIDLVRLKNKFGTRRVLVGRLFGGIAAEAPNGGPSVASNVVFDVFVTPR